MDMNRGKSVPVGLQESSTGSSPGPMAQQRQSDGGSTSGVQGGPSNEHGIETNARRAVNSIDIGTVGHGTKPEQHAGLSTRKYATMERSRSSASGIPPSPAMDRRDSVDLSSSSRGWMPGLGAATIRGAQANRLISQNHKSHTMKRDKHAAIPHVDSFSNNVQDDFMARAVQRITKLGSNSGTRTTETGHADSPAGDSIPEHYTSDHIRLLYMIFCHTTIQVQNPDEEEEEPIALDVPPITPASHDEEKLKDSELSPDIWIRKMPLMVMLYEGIVKGVFEYDYAPAADLVDGCRVYLNLTQEGRDDLDDLRESGLIFALKVSSVSYVSTVSFRVTPDGVKLLCSRLTQADIEAVNSVIFAPDGPVLQSSLLRVKWDPAKRVFVMYTTSGYSRNSTITDVESVSYVSSPWIPQLFRRSGRETTDNAGLVGILETATSNIKDELNEVVNLDELKVFFGEWIPMGANQIVALNDRLGSSERVQGGLFTAAVDLNPLTSNFQAVSTGLTEVKVLDYDEPKYVNFEAEVHFPEEEGIVQIENFGVHINEEGFLAFGMTVDGIMDRVKTNLSLDHLSRLMVDVYIDSSKVLDNLLSPHQRLMLNTTYANHAAMRKKYVCICASAINPLLPAASYLDKEARENELKQVIGDIVSAHDLDADERLIVGKDGLLLISSDLSKHEPILMSHLSLMSRNLFMSSLFQRSYILMDRLKQVRSLIYDHEANPNSVSEIRNMLSQCNADIILLNELQLYLTESLHDFAIPEPDNDPAALELCKLLHPDATLQRLHRRIRDMVKSIRGSDGEADGLRSMVDAVSESQNHRVQEAVQDNTKNLEDVYRANARASTSLEIMQVVLAGSLAFDLFDRVHGLYLGDAALLTLPADIFRPIYDTAGALLGINLACWLILGLFIKFLLNHFATQAAGWMAIRYTINVQYDFDAMEAYLKNKQPEVEGGESDKATVNQKYSWTEQNTPENRRRWAGEPPKIEITLDTRHRFLLKAFIQVVTRRSKIDQTGVRQTFFGELREAGVIQGYVAGIEEAPDSDDDQDEMEPGDGKPETQNGAQGMMRKFTGSIKRLASSINNRSKVVPEARENLNPPYRSHSIMSGAPGALSKVPSSLSKSSDLSFKIQRSQDLSSFSLALAPKPRSPGALDGASGNLPQMGSIRAQLERSQSQRMRRSSGTGSIRRISNTSFNIGSPSERRSSKFGTSSFNAEFRSSRGRAKHDGRAAQHNQINYMTPAVEGASLD